MDGGSCLSQLHPGLFLDTSERPDPYVLFRMKDGGASGFAWVFELMVTAFDIHKKPSVSLKRLDDRFTVHGLRFRCSWGYYAHMLYNRQGKNTANAHKNSAGLTVRRAGRMVRPINGKNPLWGPSNLLFQTVSRHVSYGYFCARNLGASSRLGREGGEYKTLRGNKPACLWTGLKPPATSAVLQSLIGGVVKRRPEGFDMTDDVSGRNPPENPQIKTDNATVRGLSRAERAAIHRRATDVATMLFPYVRDYMVRSALGCLRTSPNVKISALPMPPDVGLMIARYRTFGVDGFDPRKPHHHRRVCSVGAALSLVEAVTKIRAVAGELDPEMVLTDEGNDWAHDQITSALSDLLSIEIDAGLL
jgi:hypothetical protein